MTFDVCALFVLCCHDILSFYAYTENTSTPPLAKETAVVSDAICLQSFHKRSYVDKHTVFAYVHVMNVTSER